MKGLHLHVLGTAAIRRHTHGLADIAAATDPAVPVSTCGEWSMADLVWHMGEVQDFWAHVIGGRPDARPEDYTEPERPADADLAAFLSSRCTMLTELLDSADPAEAAWSWADDHTVGFTVRRQTHEALIHHLDGVLAAGAPLPSVEPELAADGIDELVRVHIGDLPDWSTWHPGESTVVVVAADTGDRWAFRLGRMTGTSPATGRSYDLTAAEPETEVVDASLTLEGPAFDLLAWAWGRGDLSTIDLSGEPRVAADVREMITNATQ